MISTAEQLPVKLNTWMPMAGRWTFLDDNTARFDGPLQGFPVGLALGTPKFRGGEGSLAMRFHTESNVKDCGGFAIGYSSQDSGYAQITLGGFGHAYSIQEY